MPVGAIIALVIVIVVIAAAAALAVTRILRGSALRRRFGAEYDRLVSEVGPRRAQAQLAERQRRVRQLTIRPLTPERRTSYASGWASVQELFVDSPANAAEAAATLVIAVAADRGYSTGDYARLLEELSVHHADRLEGYRRARQTAEQAGTAPTEDLRQALLAYRALFRELLGPPDSPDSSADRPAITVGANAAHATITHTARGEGGTSGDRPTADDVRTADESTGPAGGVADTEQPRLITQRYRKLFDQIAGRPNVTS